MLFIVMFTLALTTSPSPTPTHRIFRGPLLHHGPLLTTILCGRSLHFPPPPPPLPCSSYSCNVLGMKLGPCDFKMDRVATGALTRGLSPHCFFKRARTPAVSKGDCASRIFTARGSSLFSRTCGSSNISRWLASSELSVLRLVSFKRL